MTVYCQVDSGEQLPADDTWNGVGRVFIPTTLSGAAATVQFDWSCTLDVIRRRPPLVLTLGYNTAIFGLLLRIKGITNIINMDGVEWARAKWGPLERAWLWMNERFGCWFGNHLIADHPEIKKYLSRKIDKRKITTIAYGAPDVSDADFSHIRKFSLEPRSYAIVIARPEPENSILEIVRAFSQKRRGRKLVVLGKYDREKSKFHEKVMCAASPEVVFLGAIYDKEIVEALRYGALLYVHGHRVGGTNPSLVEALGSGCAVLAHDNRFNRWVTGPEGAFFEDEDACASLFDALLGDEARLHSMSVASRARHHEAFQWSHILSNYESLLLEWLLGEASDRKDANLLPPAISNDVTE